MTDIIAMSQSCSKCGETVVNDDPAIKHPLDFLQALRDRGWFIPNTQYPLQPTSNNRAHCCPKCIKGGQ